MPWYPSAKACPAAIKPTVQCFFPTLYQVLLFDFSSFGEKLFFCLRGYAAQSREARCKNSRSAERGCSSVHPPPNRRRMGGGSNLAPPPAGYAAQSREARCKNSRSAERGCSSVYPPPNRRRMGGGSNLAPPPTGYAAQSREARCKKTAGAQSAAPAGAFRSATAAGGTWRGDRMFLCLPAAEQAANGWRQQPCPTTNRLSPRNRAKRGAKNSRSAERCARRRVSERNRRRRHLARR